jgi:hypothetical protein
LQLSKRFRCILQKSEKAIEKSTLSSSSIEQSAIDKLDHEDEDSIQLEEEEKAEGKKMTSFLSAESGLPGPTFLYICVAVISSN